MQNCAELISFISVSEASEFLENCEEMVSVKY